MEKIPRRVYTKEFKDEAAQLVLRDGLGLTEAARRLSISMKTLANWVAVARHGKPITVSSPRQPVTELEAEVSRLRRELAEMKQERDVLKNGPPGLPRPLCIETRSAYTVRAHGQWPIASWRFRPRQKTCPRGSCGPSGGGAFE